MRPKKAKEFIPEVAKETNHSEQLVTDVINFYWSEVRKSMSTLAHNRIHITNLGDFVVKHWKVDDKIEGLEKFEEKNKQKGMQQMTARFKTAENLFDLRKVKAIIEEENQRKSFIKMHKAASYESKGEHIPDMEVEGSDPGRDN